MAGTGGRLQRWGIAYFRYPGLAVNSYAASERTGRARCWRTGPGLAPLQLVKSLPWDHVPALRRAERSPMARRARITGIGGIAGQGIGRSARRELRQALDETSKSPIWFTDETQGTLVHDDSLAQRSRVGGTVPFSGGCRLRPMAAQPRRRRPRRCKLQTGAEGRRIRSARPPTKSKNARSSPRKSAAKPAGW